MPKWIYTGKVYKLSEFEWLAFQITCSPLLAHTSDARVRDGGPLIEVVPHPDDESGELWAEVQQQEVGDA